MGFCRFRVFNKGWQAGLEGRRKSANVAADGALA